MNRIRLTESQLNRVIRRCINEALSDKSDMYGVEPMPEEIADALREFVSLTSNPLAKIKSKSNPRRKECFDIIKNYVVNERPDILDEYEEWLNALDNGHTDHYPSDTSLMSFAIKILQEEL